MIFSFQVDDICSRLRDSQATRILLWDQFDYVRPSGSHLGPVPAGFDWCVSGPCEWGSHFVYMPISLACQMAE